MTLEESCKMSQIWFYDPDSTYESDEKIILIHDIHTYLKQKEKSRSTQTALDHKLKIPRFKYNPTDVKVHTI